MIELPIYLPPEDWQRIEQRGNNYDFQQTGIPDYDYQYLKMLADNQALSSAREALAEGGRETQKHYQGSAAHNMDYVPPMIANENRPEYHHQLVPEMSEEHRARYAANADRVTLTPGSYGAPLEIPYQYHPDRGQRVEDKLVGGFQNLLNLFSHSK